MREGMADNLLHREISLQVLERRLLVDVARHRHKGVAAGAVVAQLDQWLAAERASFGVDPQVLAVVSAAARASLDKVVAERGGIELPPDGPGCVICRWADGKISGESG